jgi:OOP family OmpA-OmpF porin
MKHIAAASLVVLCTLAGQVHAQQPQRGWYAGISAGQSSADVGQNGLVVIGATASTVTVEDSDTGYKVYGGYRFGRHLAVEAGYVDLGSFGATRHVTSPGIGSVKAETSVSGIFGQAVGILPLGERFSLFGTAGLFANEVKTTLSSTGGVVLVGQRSASNSDVNAKLGVGAGFDFTRNFGVRVEWERYFEVGDESVGGKSDLDLLSIGIVVRF